MMTLPQTIAQQLRNVYFGGNWCDVCLKEYLDPLSWQHAVAKVDHFNSIAVLVYHMNYYLNAVNDVLTNQTLLAKHELSFNAPTINNQEDWNLLWQKAQQDAQVFSENIERMPEALLWETFRNEEKYGNYYKNIVGIIEHNHYHLGQIVLLKKLLDSKN